METMLNIQIGHKTILYILQLEGALDTTRKKTTVIEHSGQRSQQYGPEARQVTWSDEKH